MRRTHVAGLAAALLSLAVAHPLGAQDWSPPSRQMPEMPARADLDGGWRGGLGSWFAGTGAALDQVRAAGEGSGPRTRLVRFLGGPRPVAVWTDRNGDGRADMIEIYRSGALAYQLVDADYDGTANVLRVFDASGGLAREERLK